MYKILLSPVLATAVGAVIVFYVVRFLITSYRWRSLVHKLPGPPHSWIFGHLKIMGEAFEQVPLRVHPHVLPLGIKKQYNLGSFFYIDIWPVQKPMIAIMDPDIAQQISVGYHTKKDSSLPVFLDMLLGSGNMISTDGSEWKQWRTIFNPGFSAQHLMSLVPGIVDDCVIWVENLTKHARDKTVLRLEEVTTRLTIDIIGKVALDLDFNMQHGENECIEALRDQVHLLPNDSIMNPFFPYYPWIAYRRWKNHKIMNDYIGKVLDERFAAKNRSTSKQQRKRTILDLALDSYLAGETKDDLGQHAGPPKMDERFKQGTITQIRAFIFAGHDTTSSTLCYALHLLHKHPSALLKIRQEHDAILGPVAQTAAAIKANPVLLNKLEYTTCVIKESLRLFPAASTPRAGAPDLMIRDPQTGEMYPTEGFMVWNLHYGVHRNPDVWGDSVTKFEPERFLPENAAKIPEGAFRPFENGPRNCIGQNLAMLESRIALALVCRSLDFEVALDRLGELMHDGSKYAENSDFRKGVQTVEGEEMYQILVGTAKPREGMPVRVREVDWK